MPELDQLLTEEEPQGLDLEKLLESENVLDLVQKELGEQEVKNIGFKLREGFDVDVDSTKEFFKQQEEWTKLALQQKTTKNTPWKDASNFKHPLITIASTQFGARAYPAIIPGLNVVKTKISALIKDTPELYERAQRITNHMDFQLLEEMEGWEEGMDNLLSASLPLKGTVFKKTYYDPDVRQSKSDALQQDELIINFHAESLEEAYRKSHIFYLNKNQIRERVNSGYYAEVDYNSQEQGKERRVLQETARIHPGTSDESTPYKFVEMHTYLDLDGDEYEEPWIVTFLYETATIVRIAAGFSPDGVDIDDNGEILRIKQEQYFTKYGFIPNPESRIYDLGFGMLLGPMVEVMNTLINMLVDSGTLNNLQGGFVSKNFLHAGGKIRYRMGEFQKVNIFGEDISKSIYPLPTKEPSNVLFLLLGFIQDNAKDVASVKDILLGENPGQNQKVGTTNAVLEQGLKTYTAIYKRVHRSLKSELKKLYRLNSLFLDEKKYFRVLHTEEREEIGIEDYDDNITIIPVSDSNIATDAQRFAKVEALFKYIQLGTVNPTEVTRRGLEAENQSDIKTLMTVQPPQPSFEEQIQLQELQLEAQKIKQENELKQLELRIHMLSELGKLESGERKASIELANSMAERIHDRVKLEQDKEAAEAKSKQPTTTK